MNILYMGYFCNETVFNRLVEVGSHGSHARQQLETKLLAGMMSERGGNTLEMISYLPKIAGVDRTIGEGENYRGIKIQYVWCNKKNPFSVFKAIGKNIKLIKKWAKNKQEKVVLTYSTNPIHVIPLYLLRKKCNIKVITLCSEVSAFRRKVKLNLATCISRKISSMLDNNFDGYILLTPYMNEIVNQKKKPYIVMEGIANEAKDTKKVEKNRAILYAGGLTEDNGIAILLDGFARLKRNDVELWICGEGEMKEQVKKYSRRYGNIRFFGILPNDQVQEMEKSAMLLISPRFTNNEFTKYSFPSKTLEYMSTGTPTILTRLAGIPSEYFDYVYILENETSEGIQQLLDNILEQPSEKLNTLGEKAKAFVLKNKSVDVQAKRILEFMSSFCKNNSVV